MFSAEMFQGAISLFLSCHFRAKLKVIIGLRVLFWFQTPILRAQIHAEASAKIPWGLWQEQVKTHT